MAKYKIEVVRGNGSGTLSFSGGSTNIQTTCWWDPEAVLDARTYPGYATYMSNKENSKGGPREAIWLGEGVTYNGNGIPKKGAFIHMGTGPGWSDGCIVCDEAVVLQIWTIVTPKETANIEVVVRDQTASRGGREADESCTDHMSHMYVMGLGIPGS